MYHTSCNPTRRGYSFTKSMCTVRKKKYAFQSKIQANITNNIHKCRLKFSKEIDAYKTSTFAHTTEYWAAEITNTFQ